MFGLGWPPDRYDDKETKPSPIVVSRRYSPELVTIIRIIYILAILLWILLIYMLDLMKWSKGYGLIFILIPFVVFGIGIANAAVLDEDIENNIFQTSYLTLGVLIVLPLLTWLGQGTSAADRYEVVEIVLVALIFTLLAMVDVWARREWISVIRHLRSIFQTFALVLLLLALYLFYMQGRKFI